MAMTEAEIKSKATDLVNRLLEGDKKCACGKPATKDGKCLPCFMKANREKKKD